MNIFINVLFISYHRRTSGSPHFSLTKPKLAPPPPTTTTTMDNQKKLHIAMFPWLAYGHIMPFLHVSISLSQKGHRISFISTPKNLLNLPKHIPPHLSPLINFVPLSLPPVAGLPDSAESTSELPIHKVPYLKKSFDRLQPSLTSFLKESHVDWIIHDFAPYWLPQATESMNIKLAMFSIFNATTIAFLGPPMLSLSDERAAKPEDLTVVPEWLDYPTKVRFKLHEVLSHEPCMDADMSDFKRFAKAVQKSKFVAIRTCREFEGEALNVVGRIYRMPAVPVGLLPPRVQTSQEDEERWRTLKSWLEGKEEKSVMYVALGTEVSLNQEVMHELASGIEKSGVPFVWVVGNQSSGGEAGSGFLPPGYIDRVVGRGFVWYGWAPQTDVLAHTSVGGFLTHCGWSSVIEALGLGRPFVLFSGASSDQGLNARLLDEKRVGLEVPRNEADGSLTSEEVAGTIRRVMKEEEGEEVRANAWGMRATFGSEELQNKYSEELNRVLQTI